MSIIDRDIILRQIRFLEQLLRRALKLQQEKDFPAALDEIRGGYLEALGVPHAMLARVDVASARLLLRTPERRRAYVELLRAEAAVRRAQGEADAAAALTQRAAQFETPAA